MEEKISLKDLKVTSFVTQHQDVLGGKMVTTFNSCDVDSCNDKFCRPTDAGTGCTDNC